MQPHISRQSAQCRLRPQVRKYRRNALSDVMGQQRTRALQQRCAASTNDEAANVFGNDDQPFLQEILLAPFHGSTDRPGGLQSSLRWTSSDNRAGHHPADAIRLVEQVVVSQITRAVPDAHAEHGTFAYIDESDEGQWFAPPPASSSVRRTASRLNEPGFWRGGNFLKFSICWATTACIA